MLGINVPDGLHDEWIKSDCKSMTDRWLMQQSTAFAAKLGGYQPIAGDREVMELVNERNDRLALGSVRSSDFDNWRQQLHTRHCRWQLERQQRIVSTSSQLARAAVQVVCRAAIQQVSGLRRTADVWPDSGATSGIRGSGHKLAKAQRLQPACSRHRQQRLQDQLLAESRGPKLTAMGIELSRLIALLKQEGLRRRRSR